MPTDNRLSKDDLKLIEIGGSRIVGGSGGWEAPPFGYSDRDIVTYHVYSKNLQYWQSGGISNFIEGDNIRLKPGNEVRSEVVTA